MMVIGLMEMVAAQFAHLKLLLTSVETGKRLEKKNVMMATL